MAKVDEKNVKKLMESLGISREEALEIIEYDKGNEEVEEEKLVYATKSETKKTGSSLDKVKHQKAKKKVDAVKDGIMDLVEGLIKAYNMVYFNPQKLTTTKLTFKDKDNNYYSITLTKHKTKPDGYKDSQEEE